MKLALLFSLLFLFAGLAHAAPDEWSVTRAQVVDQTDEWTQQGYEPGWDVKTGPTIEITGDKTGAFRGTILVGRRWRVPDPLPAVLRARLRYQTYCAMDDPKQPRSGQARLVFLTPERWAMLATDPKKAQKLDLQPDGKGILSVSSVHSGNDDVLEWRDWESPDLAPALRPHAGKEVMLAVAWSAMHFHVEEWGRFEGIEARAMTQEDVDREFLEKLDLARPDLAAVKAALDRNDVPGAKAALVAHFRTREKPILPPLSPDGSERGLQAAGEILDHVFRFTGCPPTRIEGPIRWNEDPHNYDQWAIALNRHTHWVTLGRAYAATKDEKYAREFAAEVASWTAAVPIFIGPRWIEGPEFEAGKSPLSLDAGIRMGQSWWPAYAYFKDSPSFGVETQFAMLRSFYRHALYLMDPRAWHLESNWGAMEVNGLFTLAVMLPEFREAPAWMRTARERMTAAYQAQVYPDGAQIELTPGYHGVTLNNFLGILETARRNDVALPADLAAGLERMFEYYVAISTPEGQTPAFNDSGWSSVAGVLARGFALFPNRHDFEYFATNREKGTPPERTSWALPYAGWYLMRTGWKPDDRCLTLEAGPFGRAHQHEDALNIVASAGGRAILTEGGNYSYDTSDWRRYVLSTRAHNTVMVDGLEQNRRSHPETYVVREPQPRRWVSNAAFDYAEGLYDCGYGPRNEVAVAHTRQVIFVKPDYWIVIDTMKPADAAPRRYEALFHLDADDAVVDAATRGVTVEYGGNAFRVLPLRTEGVDVEIVRGQKDPVQGWLPTGQHNVLRPIPTAVYRWSGAGTQVMAYALIPCRPGEAWPVVSVAPVPANAPGELAVELRTPAGRDILVRREPDAAPAAYGPLRTDCEVAVVRLDAAGKLGESLRVGGEVLSPSPAAW